MSGMHFLIGIWTPERVLLAADRSFFAYGAITVVENEDKEFRLGKHLSMFCMGDKGDVQQFGDWTKRNIKLYAIRNGYDLNPKAAHHWIRRGIAESLRTADAYQVDTLLGGYDTYKNEAFLGSIDYLGTGITEANYLFRGFCGRFCYSILDRVYKPNMTEAELVAAAQLCVDEAGKRFVGDLSNFKVVVVDQGGVRDLPDLHPNKANAA